MSKATLDESWQFAKLQGQRLGPYKSFNPVNTAQIWQWCSAMGDKNPCYTSDQPLAPPTMMQMWTMRDINEQYAPGSTSATPYRVFDKMKLWGYPANVAVSYDINFYRYLHLGEQAKHYTTIVNISEKKTTRLGVGYFVTERVEYLSSDESLFAEASITYFQYQANVQESGEESQTIATETNAVPTGWPPTTSDRLPPTFATLDPRQLSPRDPLPPLHLPITHKLITAGAFASQDYIPVHHNLPAAREAGMPDIFMNILTTSGLLGRYLGDWAGSGSRLKQLKFDLRAPNCPGDTLVMTGEVSSITNLADTADIEVSFSGENKLGYHTKGHAVIQLPATQTTE